MEKIYTIPQKKLNETFDVAVIGGGLSGIIAAIAAARQGKKVVLIEKNGFLGGMATAGLINPFMNYCERNSTAIANGGLFQYLLKRMYEAGAMATPSSRTFREQILKCVLDDLVQENGVKVLFHSYLHSVITEGNAVSAVVIGCVSGNVTVRARYFIDATGDGNLFAFANLAYYLRQGPEDYCQPMSTCFNLTNVEWDKFDHKKANELYREFQKQGKISNPRENILLFDSPIKDLMHFNTTRVIQKNPCDVEDMTDAEIIARKQIVEMVDFLKSNISGFENSELINIADEIGVRESRRVVGLYQLTEEDVLSARKFPDSIARGTYDIDIHNPNGQGTQIKHIPEKDYYTIPYRSLVPQNCKNILVAGRSICTTHEAHASIRVMPITSCIGEAAGIAAAIACDMNVDVAAVPVEKIHAKMDEYDALY